MKYLPDYFTVPARPAPPMKKAFPDATPDCTSLLGKLLSFDPQRRLTAAAALEDPYFSNLPEATPQERLPLPVPKAERAPDTGSCDRSMFNYYTMGGGRCMESPVAPLHFPTPDGNSCGRLDGSFLASGSRDSSLGRPQMLRFPTPDGDLARGLNSSFESQESIQDKIEKGTPVSVDTCGMPRARPTERNLPDSAERGKIRKRKLDMDQALADAANNDPELGAGVSCSPFGALGGGELSDLPVNYS